MIEFTELISLPGSFLTRTHGTARTPSARVGHSRLAPGICVCHQQRGARVQKQTAVNLGSAAWMSAAAQGQGCSSGDHLLLHTNPKQNQAPRKFPNVNAITTSRQTQTRTKCLLKRKRASARVRVCVCACKPLPAHLCVCLCACVCVCVC